MNFLFSVPCQDCRVPHKDCLVCQAYFKVYGNEFLQYRFGPDRQLRSSSTPSLTSYHTPARARIPDSAPTSDDVAYSRPLSERKKIFYPESEGYSSYKDSSSHSDEMHERVKKLLEKTKGYSVSLKQRHAGKEKSYNNHKIDYVQVHVRTIPNTVFCPEWI